MLSITPGKIIDLQGAGGRPFTAFMDELMRVHAALNGARDADVLTNLRTNIRDGGVDTEVRLRLDHDDTGWFEYPTVWQYKGTAYEHVRLNKLLDGMYVKDQLRAGFALRLAIADSIPAPTRADWESRLAEQVRSLNSSAPAPRVVTADELAVWTNRYPALVLSFFNPELTGSVLHLDAWTASATDTTRVFVAVVGWQGVRSALDRHLDFARDAASAVRVVQGDAGVGKTRLVLEVASARPGARSLVLYCNDDNIAQDVARRLANNATGTAILIADECGAQARAKIEAVLQGHRERVRVIAIHNTGLRPEAPDPELLLGKMPIDVLGQVLTENFPEVIPERRRAYAGLAEGFPRLAADLCRNDGTIAARGDLAGALPSIGDYIRLRLSAKHREALEALALVSKIGYSGEVGAELDVLCQFLGLDRLETELALHAVHDGPGFVNRTARYLYVTPEIVGRVVHADAWRRWGRDAVAFLSRVPPELLPALLDGVRRRASEEVRRSCADYFRDWADAVDAGDLADDVVVERLVALTDTDASQYFRRVRRLVENADPGILSAPDMPTPRRGWGPRRALVWLAERFAQFPEHFDDAERVLLRLAVNESEPDIGNNATGIWRQLFRIFLSGTATPFEARLAQLRTRLSDADADVRRLARTALVEPFGEHISRMLGPAVVGGRLPPAEWRPTTNAEVHKAQLAAIALLGEVRQIDGETRDAVVRVVHLHSRSLISMGYLAELTSLVIALGLSDAERVDLVEAIDVTLAYDIAADPAAQESDYAIKVRAWRAQLIGSDLHGRLSATVRRSPWLLSGSSDQDRAQSIRALAHELAAAPDALRSELVWLLADEMPGAAELGEALGRSDCEMRLSGLILDSAITATSRAFARGYIRGLLASCPELEGTISSWLDKHEVDAPVAIAELAISGGAVLRPVSRILRLFDAGRIPVSFLGERNITLGGAELSPEDLELVYQHLATAAASGNQLAIRVGIDSLALRLPYSTEGGPAPVLADSPSLRELVWQLFSAAPAGNAPDARWWRVVLSHLGLLEPGRAARFAGTLLTTGSYGVREEAEKLLAELAAEAPQEVMEVIGAGLLNKEQGWRLLIGRHLSLVGAIPNTLVQAWIERVGVEGARAIARHLPIPYVTELGEPVVPPLTAWVLERFADDDATFRAFYTGTRNLQVYSGDISKLFEKEAALARRLLDHPLLRVRQWAEWYERTAQAEAQSMRIDDEEWDLP